MKNKTLQFMLEYMQKKSGNKYTIPQIAKAVLDLTLDNQKHDELLLAQIKDECFDYMVGMNEDYKEFLSQPKFELSRKILDLSQEDFEEYKEVLACHQMCQKVIFDEKIRKLAESNDDEENVF